MSKLKSITTHKHILDHGSTTFGVFFFVISFDKKTHRETLTHHPALFSPGTTRLTVAFQNRGWMTVWWKPNLGLHRLSGCDMKCWDVQTQGERFARY